MLACIPRPACRVYRKRSCVSFTGRLLNPRITSPGVKPALPAGLAGGASSTVTPVSPGVPAAETSSNPTIFFTFAPSHGTTAGLRVESRVTDLGLVVEGSSGVRAIAFNSGACTPKTCMSKFAKPSWRAGESGRNVVVAGRRVDEARVGVERVFVEPAQVLEWLSRDWGPPVWIVEQVVIDLLRPLAHTDRPVGRTYNIAAEYVVAVVEPHMRVQRVVRPVRCSRRFGKSPRATSGRHSGKDCYRCGSWCCHRPDRCPIRGRSASASWRGWWARSYPAREARHTCRPAAHRHRCLWSPTNGHVPRN